MKQFLLASLGFTLLATAAVPAFAGQATAAPTRPVYSKTLNVPEVVASDSRKLQAILDKDGTTPATRPDSAPPAAAVPQTILVMPSAATPPPAAPAPVVVCNAGSGLVAQPAAHAIAREVPHEMVRDAAASQELQLPETDLSSESSGGWYQWTSEPTSVFTACIAFFTFMLAIAGGYHVYVASATARRQLRAYVFITGTEINGATPNTQPVAQLVIRNTGQTPAHDVMVYGNMVFDEFPLKKDLPVLVFSDPQLTKENLGPGSERYKWEYALTPLTPDQVAKMHAGSHALYVYGEIRYRDVFRKKRFTKYLYYTGGNMGVRGNILGGYPEGNEAI